MRTYFVKSKATFAVVHRNTWNAYDYSSSGPLDQAVLQWALAIWGKSAVLRKSTVHSPAVGILIDLPRRFRENRENNHAKRRTSMPFACCKSGWLMNRAMMKRTGPLSNKLSFKEREMAMMRKCCGMSAVLMVLAWQAHGEIYQMNGYRIETSLVPEKSTIMLGEPIYLSFLVQNHADQDLQVLVGGDYRNALGRPESFTVTVVRADGKRVPQPDAGPSFGGICGPQRLPASGTYLFKLFLPHWATFQEVGCYTVTAKRTLQLSKYKSGQWNYREQTDDVAAQASAIIEVVPLDQAKLGEIIMSLGNAMLGKEYEQAELAARTLTYIEDERTIPYFVKAFATNNYTQKFTALNALARFHSDVAFQCLQQGVITSAEEITTTKAVAAQLAENIRITAAQALARSPHPEAIPLLLSRRNDACEGVRITVLHVLGKMAPETAIPILKEMLQDNSKLVRDEAKRYFDILTANVKK